MSNKAILALLFTIPTIALAQTDDAKVDTRHANGIAAIAENKIITVEDVRRKIAPYLPQIQQDAGRNPVKFRQLLDEAEDQIISQLTDNVLIVKKFYEDKGQIPEHYVDNTVEENIIEQWDRDRAKFLDYLKSIGKTPDEYREEVKEDIIVNYMRSKMDKTESFVSPVKIERYYTDNKEMFFEKEGVHLRLIRLTQVTDESDALLMQTARQIVQELESGQDFAELAKRHSQDARKNRGGDWGWIERDALIPELADAAFELEVGQHSDPVTVSDSIFVLYIEDRREEGYIPLEDVRVEIENILIANESDKAHDRWLERLRRDGYVRRFD